MAIIAVLIIVSLTIVAIGYMNGKEEGDNVLKALMSMIKCGFMIFMINVWVVIAAIAIILFAIFH